MSRQQQHGPLLDPYVSEFYCLDGDRLSAIGLGSGESVGGALIAKGLSGIIRRIRNGLRMSTLLRQARSDGLPLDEFFLSAPRLCLALYWMMLTRGALEIHRGAIALTREAWLTGVADYLDGTTTTPQEREEVMERARECFDKSSSSYHDAATGSWGAEVLTFVAQLKA